MTIDTAVAEALAYLQEQRKPCPPAGTEANGTCSTCHGTGEVPTIGVALNMEGRPVMPCPIVGCHGGIIHCCDPDNDGLPKGESDEHG